MTNNYININISVLFDNVEGGVQIGYRSNRSYDCCDKGTA